MRQVTLLHRCERCHAPKMLLVDLGHIRMCSSCWHRAGEPVGTAAPERAEDVDQIHRAMIARRGEDGYRAKAGKA